MQGDAGECLVPIPIVGRLDVGLDRELVVQIAFQFAVIHVAQYNYLAVGMDDTIIVKRRN